MRHALEKLLVGECLSVEEAHAVILEIMNGQSSEVEIAALLTALRIKGETVEEIAGAAKAMREKAAPIPTQVTGKLDTCGTGGSGLHTFNISTAVAMVAAACGVPVVKHGNRGVTSKSGSSDVFNALGVNLDLTAEQVGQCFDKIELCFCYAPIFHAAMKHVGPVRKSLGFRTIFNLLGPLTNPAAAEFQLLGTASNELVRKLAPALQELGAEGATVVCGNNELDEVSLWGETLACRVSKSGIEELTWKALDFGLPECHVDDLRVDTPEQSATLLNAIFAGEETGAPANMVLANAAAALLTVGKVDDLKAGVELARTAIAEGRAQAKLAELAETTNAV
ncbi:MAG: anthranilate phosphoribosyltransferase [Planctomycetaceae bacterium]|nr:anthranilate phosphoribosyltransferase [Planctomycetaceae bacterium]MDG2388602.1 anthranilate phosphoribosyltransferase [Planctomycetaceae bacterium]